MTLRKMSCKKRQKIKKDGAKLLNKDGILFCFGPPGCPFGFHVGDVENVVDLIVYDPFVQRHDKSS